jgi:hypothetical protein
MGMIKVWLLERDIGEGAPRWRATLRDELSHHRTRIDDIYFGAGMLWTGKARAARIHDLI